MTLFPEPIQEPLKEHLAWVNQLHNRDLEEGYGFDYYDLYSCSQSTRHADGQKPIDVLETIRSVAPVMNTRAFPLF